MRLKKVCDILKQKLAIIDLGSNSVRMNIMGINARGGYAVYDQAKEMVRLSEGLSSDGLLKDEPVDRTLKALEYFSNLIEVYGVTEVHALSTAAVRQAKNQSDFVEKVYQQTGLKLRILSGEEEAYYDYLGVINAIALNDAIIVDIGGGSTEIILVRNRRLVNAISIPFGSVILTERFFKGEKTKKKDIQACEAFLLKLLKDISWLKKGKNIPIIGLGGVIRTIGKVDRNMNRYSGELMHNYQLTDEELKNVFDLIHTCDVKDIDKIEGISKRRADIMTMGIMPIKVLQKLLQSPSLVISSNGLREGYFFAYYLDAIGEPMIVPDVLRHSKYNLLRLYGANIAHALHVKKLVESLFDQLSEIHDFDLEDRKLISTAAMLHDIGMHIGYYDHHIHGMYLLLNSRIDGLNYRENMGVAFLVGNHRESQLKDRANEFEERLGKERIQRLQKLSVLLQLAEQLDRSEVGMIEGLVIQVKGKKVIIEVQADRYPELDIQSAMRFADRFEKNYDKELNIIYK